MELSFKDFGFDAFEQFWVEFLEPFVLLYVYHGKWGAKGEARNTCLSRAACEPVFGVPFHEVDLGRPRPGNFLLRGTEGLYLRLSGPRKVRESGVQTQSLKVHR